MSQKRNLRNWLIIISLGTFSFQVLVVERKDRKNRPKGKMTFGDLLVLPFGAFNPDAEVPKWIAIPIKLLLFLLIAAILIPLIIAGIVKLFSG